MSDYTGFERELILDRARSQARIAVFMQALAVIARKDQNGADFAAMTVQAADRAAKSVRWEDLAEAKVDKP